MQILRRLRGLYGVVEVHRARHADVHLPAKLDRDILSAVQLESMGDWAVTAKGIYFIHRRDDWVANLPNHPALRFLDFATRNVQDVVAFPDPGSNPGLNIIDNGRTIAFSRGAGVNHDVMLISNYR